MWIYLSDGSEVAILLADAMRILLAANPNVRLKAHQKTFLCLQILLLDNYIRQNCSNINELLRSVLNLTNSDIAQCRIGRIRKLEMRSKDIGRFLPVLVLRAACMLRLLVNSLDCSDYSATEEGFMQVRLGGRSFLNFWGIGILVRKLSQIPDHYSYPLFRPIRHCLPRTATGQIYFCWPPTDLIGSFQKSTGF